MADPREVDGHYADGAGQGVGAEKTAAALEQLAVVQPQAAAHGTGVFRRHVRIDEVGEVGDAVFAGHLPNGFQVGVVPVEILGDVIGGDGEGEDATLGVAFDHHLGKGPVKGVHLRLELAVSGFFILAANDHRVVLQGARHTKIHGDIGEGRLKSHPGGNVDVEDELLEGLLDPGVAQLIITDEGCQQGVEVGQGLGAGRLPLEGVEEVDDLAEG